MCMKRVDIDLHFTFPVDVQIIEEENKVMGYVKDLRIMVYGATVEEAKEKMSKVLVEWAVRKTQFMRLDDSKISWE